MSVQATNLSRKGLDCVWKGLNPHRKKGKKGHARKNRVIIWCPSGKIFMCGGERGILKKTFFHELCLTFHEFYIINKLVPEEIMAVLQVRDIDDTLYEALKTLAKKERRSISQEVIMMIESYISNPKTTSVDSTEEFLNLSWISDESADEIISDLRKQRKNSKRFENHNDLFD